MKGNLEAEEVGYGTKKEKEILGDRQRMVGELKLTNSNWKNS
jgi:hypothetical protein